MQNSVNKTRRRIQSASPKLHQSLFQVETCLRLTLHHKLLECTGGNYLISPLSYASITYQDKQIRTLICGLTSATVVRVKNCLTQWKSFIQILVSQEFGRESAYQQVTIGIEPTLAQFCSSCYLAEPRLQETKVRACTTLDPLGSFTMAMHKLVSYFCASLWLWQSEWHTRLPSP